MKTLKTLLIIIAIGFTTNTNAQIWKKLAKKAEKAVERTLEKKVEEKAERETDKAFDSTFNNSKKDNKKAKRNKKTNSKNGNLFGMSSAIPESSYAFSHKYIMQLNDGKKPLNIVYYLNNEGNYLGTEIPDASSKTITIMDLKKEAMFLFINNKGNKTQMAVKLDLKQLTNDAITETEYSITPTGNTKNILNYLCKEYNVKGKNMYGTVWITENAGIIFSKAFYQTKQNKELNQNWLSLVNGLPMQMSITDTSKRKPKTMVMSCVMLKAENFVINTSNYKKLM